ncbi:FAD-binding protein [Pseudenhygromyxa sp. WMMC2535]|uniref:D-arabinono-1,4-lactone oxidase n=1 Tax=Pseudenhygromyxa sp. WMMC2535 TaxID=2712867 RepID=UPI001554B2BB|nr:D-arabinono-1,4-lactone oxidase [Pseudenhygromyxa sp. WMMC2535]NVB37770.1 FAD-binding protein [Pseudenhygromyxa sp. WMMC2535]
MDHDELRRLPAYQSLTATEQAAVDARLTGWHLDSSAVAASTGGVHELEASDLRFWLASTQTRPWDMISPCEQPALAEALFNAIVDGAPGLAQRPDRPEVVAKIRDLSRALIAAEGARGREGFVRDEQLAALDLGLDELAELESAWTDRSLLACVEGAGLDALAHALRSYRKETGGVRGLLLRAARKLETGAFDLAHGGLFVATGAADHEGHYRDGVWKNWTAAYEARPANFRLPQGEDELCELIAQAEALRVVGGGHSFNDSPLSSQTMISLDRYDRVLELDTAAKTARIQAGVRLRELNKILAANDLGLPVLGSTDAQSIAGLTATDLHGTGRDHGFLSEQVLSLRIIDAAGAAKTVRPGDPLFHAAFGAIGTCGVVCELELQLVDAFRMQKATEMVDRAAAEAGIEDLLAANEHMSFYYVGGSDESESVRVHRWNRTEAPLTPQWEKHKIRAELSDFALSAFLPGVAELVADIDEDSWLSDRLAPDDALVMPGGRAFGRKLFYRHDEIEFGLPFANYQACLREILAMLRRRDFFSIIEVRFTPDQSRSLIGPGAARRTAYVELATPLSQVQEEVFARAEAIFREHGGAPHLGKKTNVTAQDMLEIHGDRFLRFQAVREAQDPNGKFLNAFTGRVFGRD